jgi:putative ABC transport system permease protein
MAGSSATAVRRRAAAPASCPGETVRALNRKALRDLWALRTQLVAIALVMACGVGLFVAMRSVLDSLRATMDTYYERNRFAQVFASLKRAPETVAARLAALPGIAALETRVVAAATLDVPGMAETASGRLISLPAVGGATHQPRLNAIHMRSGRLPEHGRADEIVATEGFALAHGLQLGDRLHAVINGHRRALRVVGIALSPEYVYTIGPAALFPDDRRFAVLWMGRQALGAAFDMEGAFNDVSFALLPNTEAAGLLARIDAILEPYGGLGAYARADQVSHWYLSSELQQLRTIGVAVPAVFLLIGAYLLNVILARIVNNQREQIAVLKAFGYANAAVGLHYAAMVAVIGVIGGGLGIALGAWLGSGLTAMYGDFYRFPLLLYAIGPQHVALALLVNGLAALLGTWRSIRAAVELPPAEAMRPQAPADYRPSIVERIGLARWLSQPVRIVLRNLERRPLKAAFATLGLAMGVAITIVGSFTMDSVDHIIDVHFGVAQREDVWVNFVEPRADRALDELRHLPGVLHAEGLRMVPARLRSEHRQRRVSISGLDPGSTLQQLVDDELRVVSMPPGGIVLTRELADVLEVAVGDEVTVEALEGPRPRRSVRVARIVHVYIGLGAYMCRDALNALMREGRVVNGAHLMVDPRALGAFNDRVKHTPSIASSTEHAAMLRSFEDTIAESMGTMTFVNFLFAIVIACGVVYNSARITLAERERELATLRVIGLRRGEISAILLGEIAVLTAAAIPLGLAIGYGLAAMVAAGLDSELFRIPLFVRPATFATAALIVILATLASALLVRRRLDRLDLIAVLKTRE